MSTRIKTKFKLILLVALLLVFYNEFLVYIISYLNWPQLHHQSLFYHKNKTLISNTNQRPVRLLLVADPQLIGENDEPWYFDWIARWDSDRYLRSTFILANSYVKPDATIYLGDLFDEGLKSTDAQFERYYQRFKSVFKFDKMSKMFGIKQIFIAGDNDIGGEYRGDRNQALEDRFEKYFGRMIDLISFNSFIKFLKLDLDNTVSFYNSLKRNYVLDILNKDNKDNNNNYNSNSNQDNFKIILNHLSIVRRDNQEIMALNEDTNAGLIIKGDSHKFEIIKYNLRNNKVEDYINFNKDPSNYYILSLESDKNARGGVDSVYELSIPTCSYRMGVPNMGYGMLTITPNGKAYISILWLPSRYNSIKLYLLFILIVSVYILLEACFKKFYKKLYFIITDNKIA